MAQCLFTYSGKNDPIPHDQDAPPTKGQVVVVDDDEFAALRDQQIVPRRSVIDVLADLRENLPGEMRIDAPISTAGITVLARIV